MLTTRGFWMLIFAFILVGTGLVAQIATLGLIGGTILLWLLWEWLVFTVRLRGLVRSLRVSREVRDERGAVESLWAGQTFEIKTQLWLHSAIPLPYVKVTERLPIGVDKIEGDTERDGTISAEQPLELTYRLHFPSPGRTRFEGLAVQIADLQGFFYYSTFLNVPRVYRVLPPLADARGHFPAVKRHNMLPILGVHPHRRPGSGSELLDLRDYMVGDPPKTIAWKASARRDRLMTKVFESEVPVRCTLFVDTSSSVRVGLPGRNALARLVEISAAVAQASAASRDLTGLCLFDENGSSYTRPARGSRHVVAMLNQLADAAGKAPSTGEANIHALLRLGYGLAQEVYPGMLARDLNHSPWWLPWLAPQPAYAMRRPLGADRFDRRLVRLVTVLWLLGLGFLLWITGVIAEPRSTDEGVLRLLVGIGLAGITGGLAFLVLWILRGYVLFMPGRRRFFHRRKRLAALLSVHYGLAPGGLAFLLEDDEQFSIYVQRFLADHHVPCPVPMFDRRGRYLFAAPGKVDVLAAALIRAVGRGRDNELFVLLVDLLELEDHIGPLLKAIKVARSRHHRVLIVCPWPPGIKPPGKEEDSRAARRRRPGTGDYPGRLRALMERTSTSRFHRAYHHLRRTFTRLGVHVVCAQGGEPVKLILQRLDQLRLLERKR
jgi:uncharacterized protein (DUF58 family)